MVYLWLCRGIAAPQGMWKFTDTGWIVLETHVAGRHKLRIWQL